MKKTGHVGNLRLFHLAIFLSAILLFCAIVISTGMGFIHIPFSDVLKIIFAQVLDHNALLISIDDVSRSVVMDIRLPRILTSACVGAGLAISGAVFQGILLNPLADPYTLGISAGAAFGACMAFLFSFGGIFSVTFCAFTGGVGTLFLVLFLSYSDKRFGRSSLSSNTLILSGIIIAAILSAGISFMKYLADEQVSVIIFWLMGSFASKTWGNVIAVFGVVVAGCLFFMVYARDLNVMSLGDKSAESLGVNPSKVTFVLLVSASLVTAVCVSVSGIIGFVGLIVPHMARMITGPNNERLIPLTLFSGALLMVIADTVTRAILPHDIPIGVLTALIGGPFFCYIFKREQVKRRSQK